MAISSHQHNIPFSPITACVEGFFLDIQSIEENRADKIIESEHQASDQRFVIMSIGPKCCISSVFDSGIFKENWLFR